MAVKLYISQPMRGRATGDIIAERKRLMAEAAAALRRRCKKGAVHA